MVDLRLITAEDIPTEYAGDPLFDDYEMTHEIKAEIFSKSINWFRED